MLFSKVFSTAVLGLISLAGITTASAVPVPVHQMEARQVVADSASAALAIVSKFQTNVYGVLPKLVDYDRAGLDTTPVFNALFQYYDETTKAILNLPPLKPVSDVPTPTEQKLIDVTNETLNSVNAVANILNPTRINTVHKQTLKGKTEEVINALRITIIITIGRVKIIIILR